ncbi:hypothetical protein RND71_024237 [Anisodus tanguticus]|uniref:Protein phosphatase n=1 Tax=Anisodus tanguticus TaxID=243964 RepID=A0AAE1RQN8_9SOLA|nr:hypothetical protein RND71_024237 [Anisodus tanguticus]
MADSRLKHVTYRTLLLESFATSRDTFSIDTKKNMAICGSRTHIGYFVGNITARRLQNSLSVKSYSVSYNKRGFQNVNKANITLGNKGRSNNFMLYQFFTTNVAKRSDLNPNKRFGLEGFRNLSQECFSSDTSKGTEQVVDVVDSSEEKIPLKLNSGSFYLPHPAKAKTGGEDAHFICTLTQAIGVADGVGGWADLGIDDGLYARELMFHSLAAIQEEPKVNLGDSGFMLVRNGSHVFKSHSQQHGFIFPYQLDCNNAGDSPSSAMVFKIVVAPGDVLIAGPQMTAQRIAELAHQRAMDQTKSSPFFDGAREAGFEYHGGKLDDITVVVRRDLRLLQAANLEEVLSSSFQVLFGKRPKQKVQLLKSKHSINVPVLCKFRCGLLAMCDCFLPLTVDREISTLLARSFFMGFSPTRLALLARIRVLVQQILLDVICVFNNVSSLSQREQAIKLSQDGFEVVPLQLPSLCFRGILSAKASVVFLECFWESDKYVLVERQNEKDVGSRKRRPEKMFLLKHLRFKMKALRFS